MTATGVDAANVPLPTGTVTFFFTDIYGGAALWDDDHLAMEAAVRRFDAIARPAIEARRGAVFKTVNDALCAVFARPEDAVSAAYELARRLACENVSSGAGTVRIALHTGTADERSRDYFGPAVNRVARLLSVSWGGQIVMSGVTAGLARDAIASELSLFDLGDHRLKDLSGLERIFQLTGPGLPDAFPPLRSVPAGTGNLPERATSFVGRERESAALGTMLRESRLTTVVGPGGIGKTRLALDVVTTRRSDYPDGAWYVELAPVASPALIPFALASALGIALAPDADPLRSLTGSLRDKRAVIVVDNCEHLLAGVATLCSALLRELPALAIVATSRQRLAIDGERVFITSGLAFPSDAETASIDAVTALSFGAIALFVERAKTADRQFVITDDAARLIAQIVRRLDGIALAIELAVPRVKTLGLERLRDRLDECFRLLTGGSRDALPHHQTLRAMLDWSYDLLDERERSLLRRGAAFVESCSLDALATIAGAPALDEFETLDVLSSLVEKSLFVVRDGESAESRYAMLETTRAYARARLAEDPEEAAAVARSHAGFFAGAMERADRSIVTTGHFEALIALGRELGNARAAYEWALENDPQLAVPIVAAGNGALWDRLGLSSEGLERSRRLLEVLPAERSRARARTSLVEVVLFSNHGLIVPAFEAARRALAEARLAGDDELRVRALIIYANSATIARRLDEAGAALDEMEPAIATLANDVRTRQYFGARMVYALYRDDLAGAAAASLQEIRYARAIGEDLTELVAMMNLAELEFRRGDAEHSIELARAIAARMDGILGRELQGRVFSNLTSYLNGLGRFGEALEAARRAVHLLADGSNTTPSLAIAVDYAALAHAGEGRLDVAATLAGFCDATLAAHATVREPSDDELHRHVMTIIDALDPSEREPLYARGRELGALAAIALVTGTDDRS